MSVPILAASLRLVPVDLTLLRLRIAAAARFRRPARVPGEMRRKPITGTAVYLAPCPSCSYTCVWSAVHYSDDTSAAADMCTCRLPQQRRRRWLP